MKVLLATLLLTLIGGAMTPTSVEPVAGDSRSTAAVTQVTAQRPPAAPAPRVMIPATSAIYRIKLTREVTSQFGLNAPVARFAAQIHQESGWRPNARSPFANGLTQFTPPTAEWIAQVYPALHPPQPFDPAWSIRAQATYMRHLLREVAPAASECELWAFALSAYNGGAGWVRRDRRLAQAAGSDPDVWFGHVENHTRRAAWAKAENRDYVQRILRRIEHAYVGAGWPGQAVCA